MYKQRLSFGQRVGGEKGLLADEFITKSQLIDSSGNCFEAAGNGDITISDMLIVTYNIGKDSSVYKTEKIKDEIQSKIPLPISYTTKSSISIPVKINNTDTLLAVCGELDLSQFSGKYDILGVER